MVTPTKVELDYLANAVGVTQADLSAALAAVPLDLSAINALGLSVISDTMSNIGMTQVQRAVILSIVSPNFIGVANPPPVIPWKGSIVSTSSEDNATGTGLHVATIHYLDPGGAPHTEAVTLKGTSPVPLVNGNKATVVSVAQTVTGSFNGNVGMITIRADSELLAPEEIIQAPIVGTVGESFAFYFEVVQTDQRDAVRNLLTGVLQLGAGTPVIAAVPIMEI